MGEQARGEPVRPRPGDHVRDRADPERPRRGFGDPNNDSHDASHPPGACERHHEGGDAGDVRRRPFRRGAGRSPPARRRELPHLYRESQRHGRAAHRAARRGGGRREHPGRPEDGQPAVRLPREPDGAGRDQDERRLQHGRPGLQDSNDGGRHHVSDRQRRPAQQHHRRQRRRGRSDLDRFPAEHRRVQRRRGDSVHGLGACRLLQSRQGFPRRHLAHGVRRGLRAGVDRHLQQRHRGGDRRRDRGGLRDGQRAGRSQPGEKLLRRPELPARSGRPDLLHPQRHVQRPLLAVQIPQRHGRRRRPSQHGRQVRGRLRLLRRSDLEPGAVPQQPVHRGDGGRHLRRLRQRHGTGARPGRRRRDLLVRLRRARVHRHEHVLGKDRFDVVQQPRGAPVEHDRSSRRGSRPRRLRGRGAVPFESLPAQGDRRSPARGGGRRRRQGGRARRPAGGLLRSSPRSRRVRSRSRAPHVRPAAGSDGRVIRRGRSGRRRGGHRRQHVHRRRRGRRRNRRAAEPARAAAEPARAAAEPARVEVRPARRPAVRVGAPMLGAEGAAVSRCSSCQRSCVAVALASSASYRAGRSRCWRHRSASCARGPCWGPACRCPRSRSASRCRSGGR